MAAQRRPGDTMTSTEVKTAAAAGDAPIPAYVPLHKVAKQLDVDGKTLRRWSQDKKFPRLHRQGRHFFVRRDELDAWHHRFANPGDLASRMKAAAAATDPQQPQTPPRTRAGTVVSSGGSNAPSGA